MPYPGWRSRVWPLILLGYLGGCGEGVQIIREDAHTGVVRYHYLEYQGHLLSPNREKALGEIQNFCQGPMQILREGPVQSRKRIMQGMGGEEIIEEQWWGIRFRCRT